MWKENYKQWKNANLSADLKNELDNLNESEIKDAFFEELSFGTGGLRGIMGVGTNRINEVIVKKITKGFANYLLNSNLLNGVAISYDNRINSKFFALTAAKTLAASGIKTFIYPELRPTPMLSFAVRHFNASGGIMITASHNPKEYNGYKVYNQEGAQLDLVESARVIDEVKKVNDIFNIESIENELINWIDLEKIDQLYLNEVNKVKINDFSNKAHILYSPLHGTGGTVVPRLLKENNYPFHAYLPHMEYDGNFTNTKSTNPEEKIAYEDLINFAKKIDADLVAVTDPDADRLGVAVKHNHEYEILNGNQTAVISLYYLLTQKSQKGVDIADSFVFKSHVTTDLITAIANDYNLKTIETLSGFKFIAEEISKLSDPKKAIFSCEESNGSIIIPFVRDKDAVQVVFLFAEIASYLKSINLSFIDYLNEIYDKYGYYYEKTNSYTFKGIEGKDKMDKLMSYFRNNKLEVNNAKLIKIEDTLKNEVFDLVSASKTTSSFPKSNTIKFSYDDSSWIIVRPSGTEPKLKIYFSANENKMSLTNKKIADNIKVVEKIIKKFE